MVEPQSSKLATRVRFPSSAPFVSSRVIVDILVIPSFRGKSAGPWCGPLEGVS
ncbi:hypothetical protein PAJL_2147 [Cutibacterium acnes HL042PA3]|nr:hypothetical protein PAJL_2147 [Cutibacterium acnes HL042PA3]